MSLFAHCLHSVAVAVGGASFDYPSEAGFPIGPSYENLALLEVHFDNSAGKNFSILNNFEIIKSKVFCRS